MGVRSRYTAGVSLFKAASTVSLFTLLSRITGLARDLLMATMFGASALTDAFNVAFRIPNLFRRLFAEGAFSQAFVPVLASTKAQEGEERTRALISDVATVLFWVLLVTCVLGVVAYFYLNDKPDHCRWLTPEERALVTADMQADQAAKPKGGGHSFGDALRNPQLYWLAGMGVAEAERMVELLLRIKPRHAMMLVEHDIDAIFALADHLTVMVNGQTIASGTPAQIRADANVQAAYLGEES